jgi:hypothetical protein
MLCRFRFGDATKFVRVMLLRNTCAIWDSRDRDTASPQIFVGRAPSVTAPRACLERCNVAAQSGNCAACAASGEWGLDHHILPSYRSQKINTGSCSFFFSSRKQLQGRFPWREDIVGVDLVALGPWCSSSCCFKHQPWWPWHSRHLPFQFILHTGH